VTAMTGIIDHDSILPFCISYNLLKGVQDSLSCRFPATALLNLRSQALEKLFRDFDIVKNAM
jgi:hypothetical protein